MILVTTKKDNKKIKHKVCKFDTIHDFFPDLEIIDPENIAANTLYKCAKINLDRINKKLERCRLLARAIECSFNKQYSSKLGDVAKVKRGRVKGHMINYVGEKDGIFVH